MVYLDILDIVNDIQAHSDEIQPFFVDSKKTTRQPRLWEELTDWKESGREN